MLNSLIKICKIVPYTSEDLEYINSNYRDFSVDIILKEDFKDEINIPTLIVGWNYVKEKFPNQNISSSKIDDNLFWTYSITENKEKSQNDIKSFFEYSIKKFFNKNIISYDFILDGEFKDFLSKSIDRTQRSFIYFHKNVCYLYNNKNTYAISLPSLEFVEKDVKFLMTEIINRLECTIFSYYNLSKYTNLENIRDVMTIENIFWSKYNIYIEPKDFNSIFLNKDMHKHIPLLMKIISENNQITKDELNSCKRQAKKDKITSWLSENKIFFDKSFNASEKISFTWEGDRKYLKLRYSDKRTITGRINCTDSFNPQMIPKESSIRKSIVSRYKDGKIALFDYKSFETRLSMYLTRNEEFIIKNMNSDLHYNTAKAIFKTDSITNEQRNIAKNINHTILYGGGDKLISEILSKDKSINVEEAIKDVKAFLNPILNTSEYINSVYKELGYIINPFGILIKPNKSYAAFNNYVQSTAADIVVDKINEIKEWLKNKKSSFMFQVHDSFVLDISPEDEGAVEEIKNILSRYNDMIFDVEVSCGKNYSEC
jgi:hypothetical protein